jgi:excisionase family DNA binding protein
MPHRQRAPKPNVAAPRRAYNFAETARILGINDGTLRKLEKQGHIRVTRFGPRLRRVADSEIDRFLREGVPEE